MSSNCLVFHTSGAISSSPAAFLFLIFLSTESSSSCINCPCLLIILMIGSCVTFRGFPSKFLKCCFPRCIHCSWLVAFSLAFTVLFLLLTSFTICHALLDSLSSTKCLILLIWFCMYSVCSFRCMLANSFYAFSSLRALVLVGVFLLYLEAAFMSACFFITANISHGTLGLALCLVGMYSAVTSKWELMKFSHSSFGTQLKNLPSVTSWLCHKLYIYIYMCVCLCWTVCSPFSLHLFSSLFYNLFLSLR